MSQDVPRINIHTRTPAREFGACKLGILRCFRNRMHDVKPIQSIACVFALAVIASLPVAAEEPFIPFLNGLRERGYHQVALDYLAQMQNSPLATDQQRRLIPYQRALTLVAYSRTQRDIDRRLELLQQGEQQLRQFVDSQSGHPKAFAARSELANMIVERARIKLEQSKSGNRAQLVAQARKQFAAAIDELSKLEAVVTEQLETIPKVLDTRDREEAKLAQRRTQLRADNLQTELLAAAIREELAATYPEGSEGHSEQLTEAAAQYDSIYKKYRSRLAGLYARMYQGRCNAQMGKTKDALAYYGDLLDQPDQPEDMQRLKTEALRLAMDCWLAPNERKYLEAIKQATRWMEVVPRNSQRTTDMLAIRLSLARAYQMQAEDFARRGMNQSEVSRSLLAARENAEFVAGEEGPLREAAEALATSLGSQRLESGPVKPTTFAEAANTGRESLDQIGPASNQLAALRQRSNSSDASDLDERIATAEQNVRELKETALSSYRSALALADESTPPTDLNLARYFLCYLYYLDGDWSRAAVAGDFVSRKYPGSDAALPCAKIALVCYNTLFDQTDPTSDRSFELERIFDTTVFIAETWPQAPDAVQVLTSGVPIMANADDVEKCRALTELIPESSPQRSQADLITGHAFRRAFNQKLLDANSPRAAENAVSNSATDEAGIQELELLRAQSHRFLVDGFQRLPKDPPVNAFNVSALLLAAESLLEESDPELAVQVLEHPKLGPLTLVNAKHPAVSDPQLNQQCLQVGLRAYVASIDQGEAMIGKAKSTMVSLREAVGDDAAGKKQMLAIYVRLAQSIEQQIKSASDAEKQRLSKVFESFLTELGADSTDPGVLLWVANTYVGLGAGFEGDASDGAVNPAAQKYYSRAASAIDNLLGTPNLDPALLTQIRARAATVKALQRDYAGSLEIYRQLLQPQPNVVNLQVEAARLLGRWGKSDPKQYERAVLGVGDGPGRTIWGWAKIASATMSRSELRDTFFESRYEVARCRTEFARSLSGQKRQQQISEALRTLKTTRTLYPSISETDWAARFKTLETRIDALR